MRDMNFYFITDSNLTVNGVMADVREALEAGANVVQYRDKNVSTAVMYQRGREIRDLCRKYGATYIVNDRVDIALATDADGVHIGQDDMPLEVARKLMGPDAIIGVSCSTKEEALAAVEGGADYIGAGPVFATTTKPDALPPIGLEGLRAIADAVDVPIVAIGGISLANLGDVIKAGATTVSAISATVGDDVAGKVKEFIKAIEEMRNEGE